MTKSSTGTWEALGMAFGAVMLDKAIDSMLTPETIARLIKEQMKDVDESRLAITTRLVASEKTSWVNDSTFRLKSDEHSYMTWRRQGMSWRLTSVTIPLEKPSR